MIPKECHQYNKIYVTDVTTLVEADLATGEVLKKYTTEGTTFLNDVAVAPDGAIYVSDTSDSILYQLSSDGKFIKWMENPELDHPNGLLVIGTNIYVASWGGSETGGRILKINMETNR